MGDNNLTLPTFRRENYSTRLVTWGCNLLAAASLLVFVPTFRDYSHLPTRLAQKQAAANDAILFGTLGAFLFAIAAIITFGSQRSHGVEGRLTRSWFVAVGIPLIFHFPIGWLAIGVAAWLIFARKRK